jgi:hypothetical protein
LRRPIQRNDFLLGFRAGQGRAFEGAMSLGANLEYIYTPEFGFGAQFFRATYGTEISVGPMQAKFTHTSFTVVGLGNFHPGFIRVRSFDPFLSVGLAHSFVSSKGEMKSDVPMPAGAVPEVKVGGNSTFLVASLNGRYFFDRNLSAVGSLGLGLSTLTVGLDYLF